MVNPQPTRPKPQPRPSFQQKTNNQRYSTTNSRNDNRQQRRTQSLTTTQALSSDQNHDNRRPSSPVISSTPRLSIADRFMSSSSSSSIHPHSPLAPSSLSYSSPILNEDENMPTNNTNTTRSTGLTPLTRHLSSNTLTPISEQNASRLTIASAFMKVPSSPLSLNHEEQNTTVHPLDTSLERSGASFELNLDLTPTPKSPSCPQSGPFGSQDTLVNSKQQQQQKCQKAQGSGEEEYYDVSLDDYYQQRQPNDEDDDERHENSSDLSSTRHGHEENDVDLQHNKLNGKQQHQHDMTLADD
ncbi:unnamed protein product [Absidia cylindrospora]